MGDILIRQALPEDAEDVLTFLNAVGGETDNLSYGAEGLPITVEQEQSFLREMEQSPHSVFLIARSDGSLVGVGSLSGQSRQRMRHRAELSVAVGKAHWGQGVGSRLLCQLLDCARDKGIEIVSLEVRSGNERALRLYEKYGFRRIGTFPGFFKIGDSYADFELMYLDLR